MSFPIEPLGGVGRIFMRQQAHVPSPDEIWKILKEVSLSRKEADRQMREADRRFQKSFQKSKEEADRRAQEMDRRFQKSKEEADRRMKEMDRLFQKSKEEADRRAQEMDRRFQKSKEEADRATQETKRIVQETALQIKQTEKQLKQTDSRWGNQWGVLIEALIKGSLVKRLNERGLKVRKAVPNYQGLYKGKAKEFDLIAADGTEIVVVETKSHLSKAKTNQFLKVMEDFKKYCPEFSSLTVYAGMACLRAKPETLSYAEGKGLFVIQVSGQNAVMLNKKEFKPKIFCPDSEKENGET